MRGCTRFYRQKVMVNFLIIKSKYIYSNLVFNHILHLFVLVNFAPCSYTLFHRTSVLHQGYAHFPSTTYTAVDIHTRRARIYRPLGCPVLSSSKKLFVTSKESRIVEGSKQNSIDKKRNLVELLLSPELRFTSFSPPSHVFGRKVFPGYHHVTSG